VPQLQTKMRLARAKKRRTAAELEPIRDPAGKEGVWSGFMAIRPLRWEMVAPAPPRAGDIQVSR